MASKDDAVSAYERRKKRWWRAEGFSFIFVQWCAAVVLSGTSYLLLSLFFGLVADLVANSSITSHNFSAPSQCRIVSSSVDIRSSKVEFRDQLLGHERIAWAESPTEALPLNCRPNFEVTWLTKEKFKVNETYDFGFHLAFPKSAYLTMVFLVAAHKIHQKFRS